MLNTQKWKGERKRKKMCEECICVFAFKTARVEQGEEREGERGEREKRERDREERVSAWE